MDVGTMDTKTKVGVAKRWALLSVASNSFLVAVKLIVALLTGSLAVMAEAAHSGIDLLAALVAFVAVRAAAKGPDYDHPYGHGKFESIAAAFEAVLIVWVAIEIGREAVFRFGTEGSHSMMSTAFLVMMLSAVINYLVSRKLFQVAKQTESVALEGDAWHLRTDVWSSLVVAMGVAVVWATGWSDADALFALLVALFIGWAGLRLIRETLKDLSDRALPADQVSEIRTIVGVFSAEFESMHALRTRKSGRNRYTDFHLVVSRDEPLGRVHDLCDRIEGALKERFEDIDVTIHVEPTAD